MTKEFKDRVMRECIVDTRKYRYVVRDLASGTVIQRLPIDFLGTTLALTEWETVK